MPAMSMILLFIPLLYPIFIGSFGFDPIWFGVFIVVMVELAVTSPVAMHIFAFQSLVRDVSTTELWQGITPFVAVDSRV